MHTVDDILDGLSERVLFSCFRACLVTAIPCHDFHDMGWRRHGPDVAGSRSALALAGPAAGRLGTASAV